MPTKQDTYLGSLTALQYAATLPLESASDPLAVLRAISDTRIMAERVTPATVALARENGASWTGIGEALCMSRQAAWERFGK